MGSRGHIEIITGPMFSGKSSELMRRVRLAEIAGQSVGVFKPAIDTRSQDLQTHDKIVLKAQTIQSIRELDLKCQVVAIDEAQFFDRAIVPFAEYVANNGGRVILAGLDLDALGLPFGHIPDLMCRAEFVTKLQAVCMRCKGAASFTYRKSTGTEKILIGGAEEYEARCRGCFIAGRTWGG